MMKITKIITMFLMFTVGMVNGDIKYHVTDISKIAEDTDASIVPEYGYAINDACMITGHGETSAGGDYSKPYLYNPSTGFFTNVGNLAGSFDTGYGGNGYAINNQGFVTGRDSISDTSWAYRAFLFRDANSNGIVDTGELSNLNPEGGSNTGNDINNRNQIVGYNSTTSTGWVWTDTNSNYQYDEGEKQYFTGLVPTSINDSGTIILASSGTITLWPDVNSNGIYETSEKQILPFPTGATSMTGNSINNNGDICGYFRNSGSKNQGFYWTDRNRNGVVEVNEYSVFGTALRNAFTRASNDRGEVAGGTYEWDTSSSLRSAFIWTVEKGMVNLNNVSDSYTDSTLGTVTYSQAEGINNHGVIVVSGWFDINSNDAKNSTDPEHVFVFTPYVPGDIDSSGDVNLKDYSILSANYGRTDCSQDNGYCNDADINNDSKVNLDDIKILAENWLLKLN